MVLTTVFGNKHCEEVIRNSFGIYASKKESAGKAKASSKKEASHKEGSS